MAGNAFKQSKTEYLNMQRAEYWSRTLIQEVRV